MKKINTITLEYIFLWASFIFLALFIFIFFKGDNLPKNGQKAALILDVSKSMRVQDIESVSRLDAAKKFIIQTIEKNRWTQFSLTIFAGEAQRVMPFTQNYDLLATFVQGLDSRNITKQGTNIEEALLEWIKNFDPQKDQVWSIVMVTDGDEEQISLSDELKNRIIDLNKDIFIVWTGTKEGGFIPTGNIAQSYKTFQWKRVVPKLNASWLKNLAGEIKGEYIKFSPWMDILFQNSSSNTHSIIPGYYYLVLSCIFFSLFSGVFFLSFIRNPYEA